MAISPTNQAPRWCTAETTLTAIDWQQPWLHNWRALGQPLAALTQASPSEAASCESTASRLSSYAALNCAATLDAAAIAPVQFVAQSNLPATESYENFIFKTRQCPTREGLHDFFNGLCWLQFPLTKTRINELHYQQQLQQHPTAAPTAQSNARLQRGPVRDALTVFDENGALLTAPAPLWEALLARNWQRLFVELRPLWSEAKLILFGHALLEKLCSPHKAITAHVWCAPDLCTVPATLDHQLAQSLHADYLRNKPFTPLPVLGVPNWWLDNQNADFYNDLSVFRAPRFPLKHTTIKK